MYSVVLVMALKSHVQYKEYYSNITALGRNIYGKMKMHVISML